MPDWLVGTFVDDAELSLELGHHHVEPRAECKGEAHINLKEMWAVVSAARRWSYPLEEPVCVVFVTDNTTVQAALSTGRCCNRQIMIWVKELFWLSVEFNFDIKSTYIRSKDNIICDALSRWRDPPSKCRIQAVDQSRQLCCQHLFT